MMIKKRLKRALAGALFALMMLGLAGEARADVTIAVGGTAQTVWTAGQVSRGCFVQNPQSATAQNIAAAESLWISFDGSAASPTSGTSMEILPGATWPCPLTPVGQVSVYGVTTGHRFNIIKW
jgi:hypothetical protein